MQKKILIVDDEMDLTDIISHNLKRSGWTTECANNGKLAIEKIRSWNPDVILSDIKMPEMDGLELLEYMCEHNIVIPLIFISAFRDIENMRLAWARGAFDFLDKPFNAPNLLAVVDNAFVYGKDYVNTARTRFSKQKKLA